MMPQATIVDAPNIRLMVVRAEQDLQEDIKAAWRTLESKLDSLKGRKFYGVCYDGPPASVYYAGVVPKSDQEVVDLGLPTLSLKAGKYARIKLADWPRHTDQIGAIASELIQTFRKDPGVPVVEHYRSQSELHMLIALTEDDV